MSISNIHTRGRTFHTSKMIARVTACSSYRCEIEILGRLARDFSVFSLAFSNVSCRKFFRKSLASSERSDRFQPEKV